VFVDMLKAVKKINDINNILNMKITQPVLLLSGSHDPATDFGDGVLKLHEMLQSEFKDIHVKIYKEGRHDTLQEINREEVFRDIVRFLEGTR
jgi:alpha-beta hydrolase superfamily lysophospholipase